jgi:hypothetical protein
MSHEGHTLERMRRLLGQKQNSMRAKPKVLAEGISHSEGKSSSTIHVTLLKQESFPPALPHENLPFFSSSRQFPTTLLWPFLQGHSLAQLLGSGRRIWYSLKRKRKMFHEASLHLAIASAPRSHDAGFKRREEWNDR